jgi:hypothetical protein
MTLIYVHSAYAAQECNTAAGIVLWVVFQQTGSSSTVTSWGALAVQRPEPRGIDRRAVTAHPCTATTDCSSSGLNGDL